jgi:hypothetical protein
MRRSGGRGKLIASYSDSQRRSAGEREPRVGTPLPPGFVKTLESTDTIFTGCKDLIPESLQLKIGKDRG